MRAARTFPVIGRRIIIASQDRGYRVVVLFQAVVELLFRQFHILRFISREVKNLHPPSRFWVSLLRGGLV